MISPGAARSANLAPDGIGTEPLPAAGLEKSLEILNGARANVASSRPQARKALPCVTNASAIWVRSDGDNR